MVLVRMPVFSHHDDFIVLSIIVDVAKLVFVKCIVLDAFE